MTLGLILAIIGAALAAILPGIGSAYGVQIGGQAAAGVTSEKPELFGKLLVLQALPGTQGIYGLLIAFLTLAQIGIIGGEYTELSLAKGLLYFVACLPMGFVGLWSAKRQARASVASINLLSRKPDQFGKSIILPAMVETYAVLALLISLLAVANIGKLPL